MDSTTFRLNLAKTYINAMEILVEEEVNLRLEQLSESHRSYLNRMEMIAHALNQLPVLYATGERGLAYQLQQGKQRHGTKIKQSVQEALATVLHRPVLNYVPINQEAPAAMRPVLKKIQALLQNRSVNWENLPDIIENLTQYISEDDLLAIVNVGNSTAK